MKLDIPTLESYVEELKRKKENETRLTGLIELVETPEKKWAYNYSVLLTAVVDGVLVLHKDVIGSAFVGEEDKLKAVAEATQKKIDEIMGKLKREGITVKEGVWRE